MWIVFRQLNIDQSIHPRSPHVQFSFELQLMLFSMYLGLTNVDESQFELAKFLRVLESFHFFGGGRVTVLQLYFGFRFWNDSLGSVPSWGWGGVGVRFRLVSSSILFARRETWSHAHRAQYKRPLLSEVGVSNFNSFFKRENLDSIHLSEGQVF